MLALLRGPKGDTGEAGAGGAKGDTGDAGAQGEQGEQGPVGAAGALNYVDRGDPAVEDFDRDDVTEDGNWHDLDLSSIVPANAVMVHIHVTIDGGTANSYFYFRKNGNSNDINMGGVRGLTDGQFIHTDVFVACDANRVVEYMAANWAYDSISIRVRGWVLSTS